MSSPPVWLGSSARSRVSSKKRSIPAGLNVRIMRAGVVPALWKRGTYSSSPAVVVAVTRMLLGVGGRRSSPPGAPVTSGDSLVSLSAQLVFLALSRLDAVLELLHHVRVA